jgi:dimethylhistidine N-methyltransferase
MTAEPASSVVAGPAEDAFAEDVRTGLTSSPKRLKPKYFYDPLGSRLFEAICELPEYYLTRAETAILVRHGADVVASLDGPLRLVELGSGDAAKSRYLIEALLARQPDGLDYVPIDISESALERSAEHLNAAYPGLRVHPRAGDYMLGLEAMPGAGRGGVRTLVLFLGSTIGNLHPGEAVELLSGIRARIEPGDGLLLGLDLKKSEAVLIPAYDDPLGVTAAFNLNLLVRINRELGGGFDLGGFAHRAVYDAGRGRVEMHIVSRRDQRVPIESLGLGIEFTAGEFILSECSYKFDRGQVERFADASGFALGGWWTDPDRLFSSALLVAQ